MARRSQSLGDANGEHAGLPGLQLRVAALPEQHQQRSLAELGELLRDLQQQQVQLEEQWRRHKRWNSSNANVMRWNSSWCSWTPNCGTTARCRPCKTATLSGKHGL